MIHLAEDNDFSSDNIELTEISRVDCADFTYNDFVRHMVENIPVIIRLNLERWESYRNWFRQDGSLDTEYLRAKIGDVKVPVANCSEQYFNSHAKVEMSFFEFLDNWETGTANGLYLKDWHLRNQKPDYEFYRVPEIFASDFLNEFLVDTEQDDYKFVYMGKAATYTPFHSDVFSSFSWSVNLRGRKRWYMLPLGEEDKLRDAFGNLPFLITPQILDEKCVKYFTVIQETQEAIFVPTNWFHQVHNELDTVSINHNWFNACNLEKIWKALEVNAEKVEQEISDCKDMDNFKEHCHVMLSCHFGMDFAAFLDLIEHITKKRCNCIDEKRPLEIVDGHVFDDSHLVFDLKRIWKVVKKIQRNSDVKFLGLKDKCDTVLDTIQDSINI